MGLTCINLELFSPTNRITSSLLVAEIIQQSPRAGKKWKCKNGRKIVKNENLKRFEVLEFLLIEICPKLHQLRSFLKMQSFAELF